MLLMCIFVCIMLLTVCEYNVHKACYESIEETCPGPKKRKVNYIYIPIDTHVVLTFLFKQ